MNILKPAKPQNDVEKWVSKIDDLKRQREQAECDTDGAFKALAGAMLEGSDDGGEGVVRLEIRKRGLDLAIKEAQGRLAAAHEDEKARKLEAAKAAEVKLLAAVREAWVEYGRTLAAEFKVLEKVHAARWAYFKNIEGKGLNDRASGLGGTDEALGHLVRHARAFEVLLGAEDFARTGLPKHNLIELKRNP